MGNDYNDDRFHTGEQGGDGQKEGASSDSGGQDPNSHASSDEGAATGSSAGDDYSPYGGNINYKWNYDDYQKGLDEQNKSRRKKEKKPRGKNRGLKVFFISVGAVFVVGLLGLAGLGVSYMIREDRLPWVSSSSAGAAGASGVSTVGQMTTTDKPAESGSSAAAASGSAMSAADVVKAVRNSIVTIEVYDAQSLDPTAEGSGIVESAKEGYVITNEHVIDQAVSIDVVTSDGKSHSATLVGKDTRTDLAVLKVDASGLTAATFGNSDQLQVGEQVLAIGNPGGIEFSGSVSSGIVSALNRTVTSENNYSMQYIQTDAAINPGNSGGALMNMYGQVVGITSSKIAATGYEGMGFAIPVNTAKPVINDLIQYGYVQNRVKIGIQVAEISSTQAAVRGYPAGLLVANVDSSSDAAAKGLKVNDIITKIDGKAASSYDVFYQQMSTHKAGDTVKLTVFRISDKSTFEISVKLQQDKGDSTSSAASSSASSQRSNGYSYGYGNQNNQNNSGSYSFDFGY